MNIKKGDVVKLKQEYMDEGDELLTFYAINDMDKGRVLVSLKEQDNMLIKPSFMLFDYMINY